MTVTSKVRGRDPASSETHTEDGLIRRVRVASLRT